MLGDIRLKTYVMLFEAGRFVALEALSIIVHDVDFDADPVKLFIRRRGSLFCISGRRVQVSYS
jgi:hypothetical protein